MGYQMETTQWTGADLESELSMYYLSTWKWKNRICKDLKAANTRKNYSRHLMENDKKENCFTWQ